MQMTLSVPIPISDVAPIETMAAVASNGELGKKRDGQVWSQLARANLFVYFLNIFPTSDVKTVTSHCTSRECYPPEFKPIMDNNHITGRYIKGLAYLSVGSHSGTFQKSTHSRAPTRSLICMY